MNDTKEKKEQKKVVTQESEKDKNTAEENYKKKYGDKESVYHKFNGKDSKETYKYNGKEYNIRNLKDRLYDDWGSTVYRTNAGGYSDAELDHAVSNLLDGMYDGTITWNDKKHNFTLRGDAYRKQKDNEMYQNGSMGNYTIYNTAAAMLALQMDELEWFREQEEGDEDEDGDSTDEDYNDTRITWGTNALGQAVFGEIFGNGGLDGWYELDNLTGNTRPVINRSGRILGVLNDVKNNFDDIFIGYSKKQKEKALKQLNQLINYINSDSVIGSNEWNYFSSILGNPSDNEGTPISWSTLMRTDFGQKEGETDEQYKIRRKKESYNKALNNYIKNKFARDPNYKSTSFNLDSKYFYPNEAQNQTFRNVLQNARSREQVCNTFINIFDNTEKGKKVLETYGIGKEKALAYCILALNDNKTTSFILPHYSKKGNYGYYYDADKGTIIKDWMFSSATPELQKHWMNVVKNNYDESQQLKSTSDDDIYNIFN